MTTERNRPDLEDRFLAGIDHTDALLDEALRETFAASDPLAISVAKEQFPDASEIASHTGSAAATIPPHLVCDDHSGQFGKRRLANLGSSKQFRPIQSSGMTPFWMANLTRLGRSEMPNFCIIRLR
jgi:hypothetical protein